MTLRSRQKIAAGLVIALVAAALITHFRSPERLLYEELAAYEKSSRTGLPRPDLVTRLSAESVPILVRWIEQPEGFNGPALFQRFLIWVGNTFPSANVDIPEYPMPRAELAVLAFEWLGTNGAAAVPKLVSIATNATVNLFALDALASIGDPAFAPALALTQSRRIDDRRDGAVLLGALRMRPEASVPALERLLVETNSSVRQAAINALAEFQCPESARQFARDLAGPEGAADDAAYVLAGQSNALPTLLQAARQATNASTRAAALAALAFRDLLPILDSATDLTRFRRYLARRIIFNNKTLAMSWQLYSSETASELQFIEKLESNYQATGSAQFDQSLSELLANRVKRTNDGAFPR